MLCKNWPRYPTIFEINTWVWLSELSKKYGIYVELGSVPPGEWDTIADFGFDAVWLMGVWERSPAGIAISNRNEALIGAFRQALPDLHPLDNVGSPYCVRDYRVDQLLGGPVGLSDARRELASRGMRLLLDFVPNHVAPDHPWAAEHPEYFIRGTAENVKDDPASFQIVAGNVFASGRDPYFPAWPDVLQLNAFSPGLRCAAKETLRSIASQCDGIRCDMAMLMMNPVFERTWGGRAGHRPATEYWTDLIPAIKQERPDFSFIAEAYWDLEWELQQQGFDFCYDKRLYDRLEHSEAENVRLHLTADLGYQSKLVRFIENHDEPRAAGIFSAPQHRAAAVTMATLPGARLFHEGQFDGLKVRLPVFLGRRPTESPDPEMLPFYHKLLQTIEDPLFHNGQWGLCELTGWPNNPTFRNLVAWTWALADRHCLVVVNLSGAAAQARVRVPWIDGHGEAWRMSDFLSGAIYDREADEIQRDGLYVALGPWEFHLFQCRRIGQKAMPMAA